MKVRSIRMSPKKDAAEPAAGRQAAEDRRPMTCYRRLVQAVGPSWAPPLSVTHDRSGYNETIGPSSSSGLTPTTLFD
jgi:hypothetical protein